jgi:glutamate N-acetyltransferase / amino-acid N-acetyltransferase
MIEIIDGSIDSVPGFRAVGVSCGIKINPNPDLGLLLCDTPCAAAGVFTTNRVQAAPVAYCKKVLASHSDRIQAIVVNSGNANACTGERGELDAAAVAEEAESLLGLEEGSALVMSTGIIGVPLPVDKILAGLSGASERLSANDTGDGFSRAILTTDTVEKKLAVRFDLEGAPVMLGAAAKGSGMVHPNMATMLGFITTDAAVAPPVLAIALRAAVESSFNLISVDGDRSPNDSVFLLAGGTAGVPEIDSVEGREYEAFYEALLLVCQSLARKIAADGEGATRLVEIRVKGASTYRDAEQVARSIANSPLVKTALHGADPNWGRIICAAGYSGVAVDPDKIDIYFGKLKAVSGGVFTGVEQEVLVQEMKKKELVLTVDLNQGMEECVFWTCDFSYDYVRINALYHT